MRRKADVPLMKPDARLLAPSRAPALLSGAPDRAASRGTGNAALALPDTQAPGKRAFAARDGAPVEWVIAEGLTPYEEAVAEMEARAAAIAAGSAAERVWLVEHPPLYTAGTSARAQDLLEPGFPGIQDRARRPVHLSRARPARRLCDARSRPAQARFARLRARARSLDHRDARRPSTSAASGARAASASGCARPEKGDGAEDKIAAIGIRVRRWVSFHGISINVEPELSHYAGIVPCGITGYGVTSLADLGWPVTMPELDAALRAAFEEVFGKTRAA